SNAKTGRGDFLVVEADEYDRTFHQLHPEIAIVTNIEADHLEYFGSFDAVVEAFRVFVEGVCPGGAIVGCVDDPVVAQLLDGVASAASADVRVAESGRPYTRLIRYGLGPRAALTARNLQFH